MKAHKGWYATQWSSRTHGLKILCCFLKLCSVDGPKPQTSFNLLSRPDPSDLFHCFLGNRWKTKSTITARRKYQFVLAPFYDVPLVYRTCALCLFFSWFESLCSFVFSSRLQMIIVRAEIDRNIKSFYFSKSKGRKITANVFNTM